MAAPQGEVSPPDGITPDFLHPKDVMNTINQVSVILCIILIALFVSTRLYIKAIIVKSFLREDCEFVLNPF
jgi:hypothetical protein